MQVDPLQITFAASTSLISILALYYGSIRPRIDRAMQDAEDRALWRQKIELRIDAHDKIEHQLGSIDELLREVISRLVALETTQKIKHS